MNQHEIEWAIDLVNEVYAEAGVSPLLSISMARQALIDAGVTEHRVITQVLKKSLYATVEQLNLLNTLELF